MLDSVKPGQQVTIRVLLNQEVTGGAWVQMALMFDPNKLSLVPGEGDGTFTRVTFQNPPLVKENTFTYEGAFRADNTSTKGLIAVLTFQMSDNFVGDTEVVLTGLSVSAPGSRRDFAPQASVVLSKGTLSRGSSDFNSNGQVDFDDLFLFANVFGAIATEGNAKFDLDMSGKVDLQDFILFANAFDK